VTILLGAATALGSARPDDASDPGRLRRGGLVELLSELGHVVEDLGDVPGLDPPWEAAPAGMRVRNVVPAIDQLQRVRGAVHAAIVAHGPPVILLGGDALVALGGLAGVRDALADDPGVVWASPLPSFHTPETTGSGDLEGMALALAVGLGAQPVVDALGGPLCSPRGVVVIGGELATGEEAAALAGAGVRVEPELPSSVPEGPLFVAVDLRSLLPGCLGVDQVRQALLAVAVRQEVAAVCLSAATTGGAGAVQVAALAAAALR
jgi:arginase